MDRETIPNATTFGDSQQQQQELPEQQEEPQQKVSNSHLRLKALSTLRNATTPRDVNLDKSRDLPREERLGKPLPPPPDQLLVKISRQESAIKLQPHPWHRFWARFIDSLVIGFIVSVPPFFVNIAYAIFSVEQGATIGVVLTSVCAIIAGLLYEPAMISMWGTTLGKAMFGIKISEQRTGEHLSFGRAFVRMWWVAWYSGQVLALVPVVGVVAPLAGHIMQYKKLVRDKITSYDERMKIRYEHG